MPGARLTSALVATLLAPLLTASLPAQLPLAEVAKVARERAERARPAQQKALEPYWGDLVLDPRENSEYLEGKIKEVAALGDAVVPLLLEKLQPAQGTAEARHLATNCRRVLERLDPGSFLDALVELAHGRNDVGRSEAIRLLGLAQAPAAVTVLADLVDRTTGEERRLVVRSLRLQRAASAAPKVVGLLASSDVRLREDVLAYLTAAKAEAVADTVVQALAAERENKLLAHYVDYFAAAVHGHEGAAATLLPLLDGERLDWTARKRVVQALATVAPKDHDPTERALHALLDTAYTTSLEVEAALTLRALGDNQGVTKLKRTFAEQMRKPNRREEAALYEQRANLALAIEDYSDAFSDFEKALKFTNGSAMTRKAYAGMMRCEARRKKWQSLLRLMRESAFTLDDFAAVGHDDPAFAEALQQDKVRSYLESLAKGQQVPR